MPCPVQQSCTAGSDDKKIGLQKQAYSVHTWQNNIHYINGEELILSSSYLILVELRNSGFEFCDTPCAKNTLRNSQTSPTVIPMRREK